MFSPPRNNHFWYMFHSFLAYNFTEYNYMIHANLYRLIFKMAMILIINSKNTHYRIHTFMKEKMKSSFVSFLIVII